MIILHSTETTYQRQVASRSVQLVADCQSGASSERAGVEPELLLDDDNLPNNEKRAPNDEELEEDEGLDAAAAGATALASDLFRLNCSKSRFVVVICSNILRTSE